ncbi:hypothetical protein RDV89_04225 [Nocardioides zeae]|uniref:Uncharacterized protein n=1 Tax=Nocardioides imazamoxiresistens TaxID=3231893 RepID=A0ABU3PSU2_9ACTN|nr:hypothetical protein [Nocardioides zeae]MDT9592258.1 hypothetical protein [Nocardioides zeae]
MRFTEREMTIAVEALASATFDALPRLLRSRAGASSWDELGKGARYPHLVAAGELVLPGLTELPERPTVGATPQFSADEYAQAAAVALERRLEAARPGSWASMSARKQQKAVAAAGEALRHAVEAMPVRQDPDAIIVPDHL